MLSILLLGGGGLYWWGLIVDQRIAVLAGAGALGGALILLVGQGGIAPAAFPTVVLAAGLAGSLKWVHQPVWQAVGWPLYGGAHVGGGAAFMLLATVAGLGYGVAYYLTGRV